MMLVSKLPLCYSCDVVAWLIAPNDTSFIEAGENIKHEVTGALFTSTDMCF